MASSSEGSVDDIDTMFPEANEPTTTVQTPQASNLQNQQQFSELSPPASEGPADSQLSGYDPMDHTNAADVPSFQYDFAGANSMDPQSQGQLSIADREPGSSWNTRKHQEEEARVRENILDKGFSLSEHQGLVLSARELTV